MNFNQIDGNANILSTHEDHVGSLFQSTSQEHTWFMVHIDISLLNMTPFEGNHCI